MQNFLLPYHLFIWMYLTTCPFNNFLNKCSGDIKSITNCQSSYFDILPTSAKHSDKLLFMKEVQLRIQNMIFISSRCECMLCLKVIQCNFTSILDNSILWYLELFHLPLESLRH